MTDRNPFGPGVTLCARHQSAMKSAIQERGLWSRVSQTRAELLARIQRNNPLDPDPLMVLHNIVMGKARHTAALNAVELDTQCPVCFFAVDRWIDEAANAVAARLVELDAEAALQRARNAELEAAARS
jgi:hypothetical protein